MSNFDETAQTDRRTIITTGARVSFATRVISEKNANGKEGKKESGGLAVVLSSSWGGGVPAEITGSNPG